MYLCNNVHIIIVIIYIFYMYIATCECPISPCVLQQEASQRSCTVKVEQGGHLVRVGITFPAHYPNGAAPFFIFDKSTTIDTSVQHELNRVSAVSRPFGPNSSSGTVLLSILGDYRDSQLLCEAKHTLS